MEAIKDTVFYKDAFLFNQIPANILDTIKSFNIVLHNDKINKYITNL